MDRSPVAQELFIASSEYEARSAGFYPSKGKKALTKGLVAWADTIFVMDELKEKQKSTLLDLFPEAADKKIIILDISNDYCRNDPKLKEILTIRIKEYL